MSIGLMCHGCADAVVTSPRGPEPRPLYPMLTPFLFSGDCHGACVDNSYCSQPCPPDTPGDVGFLCRKKKWHKVTDTCRTLTAFNIFEVVSFLPPAKWSPRLAAPLTIIRAWKQPKCPSAARWIKKLWYIYTILCILCALCIYVYIFSHKICIYVFSHKNEIGSFVVMWLDLESVIQSEVSPREKSKCCILMHI